MSISIFIRILKKEIIKSRKYYLQFLVAIQSELRVIVRLSKKPANSLTIRLTILLKFKGAENAAVSRG